MLFLKACWSYVVFKGFMKDVFCPHHWRVSDWHPLSISMVSLYIIIHTITTRDRLSIEKVSMSMCSAGTGKDTVYNTYNGYLDENIL
jgi:hypothetical protein